jgi:fumiquinazoline F synthetase
VIHHLVVDLVSWRIILGDLELLLTSDNVSEASLEPTTSFQTWSSLQAQHAIHFNNAPEKQRTIPPPQISYWINQCSETNWSDGATILSLYIDEKTTCAILGACNDTLGTRPIELMISALLFSSGQTFKDRTLPTVMSECHGRETWDE